jgi:hypothetical protein
MFQCETTCTANDSGAVSMNNDLNIATTFQFVQATPHECAPAVEAPAPFAVTVGAVNSIIITPAVLREA